jgi:hypothetical protein
MFTKEAYDIDLNILIPELDKIINYQTLNSNFKISKAEYLERLHYAADYLKQLHNYTNEPYFIVKASSPSFDFWLAFFLSTENPHKVPLILDRYFEQTNNPADFVNLIQHNMLSIIDHNIFHDVEKQLKEISSWIREKRKEFKQHNNKTTQIINLNLVQINLNQIFNINWNENSAPSKDHIKTEDIFKDGLIKSPFGNLLFEGMEVHCEDLSILNLKKLLMGLKIDSPVILKSYFKKISLIRPIKELVGRGHLTLNKLEASYWISENFEIRAKFNILKFSVKSTQKIMSKVQAEPENAQIKYEHWFKK